MFIAIAAQVVFSGDAECRPKSVDHSIRGFNFGCKQSKGADTKIFTQSCDSYCDSYCRSNLCIVTYFAVLQCLLLCGLQNYALTFIMHKNPSHLGNSTLAVSQLGSAECMPALTSKG